MAAARRKDRLRALQQELAAENAAIEIAVADASSVEDMEGLVRHTRERLAKSTSWFTARGPMSRIAR